MSAGIPVNESKRGRPKLEAGGKSESSILRWNESQHRQRSRRGVALADIQGQGTRDGDEANRFSAVTGLPNLCARPSYTPYFLHVRTCRTVFSYLKKDDRI